MKRIKKKEFTSVKRTRREGDELAGPLAASSVSQRQRYGKDKKFQIGIFFVKSSGVSFDYQDWQQGTCYLAYVRVSHACHIELLLSLRAASFNNVEHGAAGGNRGGL